MSTNYLALESYGVPTLSANTILYGDGSASVSAQPTLDFSTFAQNWNGMPVVAGTGSGYNALALSSTGQFQLAAMTGGTGIYQSNNYGQTFTALTSYVYNGATGAYPSTTTAATTWYCAGMSANGKYQAIVANGAGGLYVSSTYGVSWAAATGAPTSQNWQCVYLSATGQYQLACYAAGVLYVSSNYGATWAQTASLTAADAVAVSATGQYMLVSVQGGSLSYSNNYGATFTTSSSPTGNWTAVVISSSGQYASATIANTGSASGTIYYSTNYGVTWTQSSWASSTYQSAIWNNIYCTSNGQYHVASAGMLTANLAYYYRFNLLDQSGTTVYNGATNAYDGTLVASAAISSATSKFATGSLALSAASSQYLTLPSFTMTGSYTGITFAMWINLNTTQSAGAPRIVELGQAPRLASGFVASGSSYYVAISYYLSTIQFQLFYCTTTATTLYGSYSIPYNLTTYAGWNHVVWVLTGSTWTIYLNGAVVTPTVGTAVTVWLPPTTYLSGVYANSYIGHSNLSTDPYTTGNFNDFRMYTTALTLAQVTAIYTSAPLIAYSTNFGANWAISGASTTPSWLDVAVSSNGQYITGTTQWGAYSATTSVPGFSLSGGLIGNVGIGVTNPSVLLQLTGPLISNLSTSNGPSYPTYGQLVISDSVPPSGAGTTLGSLKMGFDHTSGTWGAAFLQSVVPNLQATPLCLQPNGGFVGIGTANPGATLQINDNSTTAASYPLMIYTPNLSSGGSQYLYFGTANSTNNVAQLGFCNVGIGSTYNYAFLQIYGKAAIMTWQAASGNVGIGVTTPTAGLHVKNPTSAMRITGNLTNSSTRPAISTTPGAFEIRGSSSAGDGADDGFLRMSAGGGTNTNQQAYIDLSGYSTVGDMTSTIVLGTLGTERMRIIYNGNVGIGKTTPATQLDITGYLSINNGVAATNAGQYQGIQIYYTGTGSTGYANIFATNPGATYNPICLNPNGSTVGIGTTNPQATLHTRGSLLQDDVPTSFPPSAMTSLTTYYPTPMAYSGFYTASASSSRNSASDPYLVFDYNLGTIWQVTTPFTATTLVGGTTYTGEWVQLLMPYSIVMTSYQVGSPSAGAGNYPSQWVIAGSTNGTTWALLDSQTGQNTNNTTVTYTVSSSTAYSIFRFIYINGNQAAGFYPALGTWNITGVPTLLNSVKGFVGIGTTTPLTSLYCFQPTNTAWAGRGYFGGSTYGIVLGEYAGVATLGAHNAALNAWANFCIPSGYVGIGTTNPNSSLTVAGNITPSVTNASTLGTGTYVWSGVYSNAVSTQSSTLSMYCNGTNGTTPAYFNYILNGATYAQLQNGYGIATTYYAQSDYLGSISFLSNTGAAFFQLNLRATQTGSIATFLYIVPTGYNSGNVYPGIDATIGLGVASNRWSAVYAANGVINTSDSTMKESSPLRYGLSEILQMNTVIFKWKTQATLPDTDPAKNYQYYGFCADQLEPVFPELVYNEDPTVPVQMNYSEILPVVVNAIKELNTVITSQAQQIATLQSTVATLESTVATVLARLTALESN